VGLKFSLGFLKVQEEKTVSRMMVHVLAMEDALGNFDNRNFVWIAVY
jgi:hypothetical protein